jgi:hypothetical protein
MVRFGDAAIILTPAQGIREQSEIKIIKNIKLDSKFVLQREIQSPLSIHIAQYLK